MYQEVLNSKTKRILEKIKKTKIPSNFYLAGGTAADLRDIACMKIDAISSRGNKKDFIDIYFLLKEFSLKELLNLFDRKYKEIKYNHLHILKSLTYFEEAEKEPLPIMLKKVNWSKIKKEITKKTKNYLKEQ